MIDVDLHVHSIFSLCGLHTVLELLERARVLGMKGFAVTDHGLTLGGRLNSVFFERFVSPDPAVRILKGIECNIVDRNGTIDLPAEYVRFLDVVLLGIHPNTRKGLSMEEYTDMLVAALRKNREIDVITHPNDPNYPVDYRRLARAAVQSGAALELNNSKILYARSSADEALELLAACREFGCRVTVSSDTHAIHELGEDSSVTPLLHKAEFPAELVVNRTPDAAFSFIAERRDRRTAQGHHRA